MFEKTMVRGCLAVAVFSFSAIAALGDTVYDSREWGGIGYVDRITSTGVVSSFASGLPGNPTALAFDKTGNLYVADYGTYDESNGGVWKITPGGVVSTYATGLPSPTALVFDGSGNLYATSEFYSKVNEITPSGVVSTYASIPEEPEGLAFDSIGDLFVSGLNGNLYEVKPGGAVSLFADTDQEWGWGLAIDSRDNLYMADNAGIVSKITAGGVVSYFAGGTEEAAGVAFGSGGTLYVADYGSQTVMKVGPAGGAMTTFATGLGGVEGVAVLVPEPSTAQLVMSVAAIMLFGYVWRRRRLARTPKPSSRDHQPQPSCPSRRMRPRQGRHEGQLDLAAGVVAVTLLTVHLGHWAAAC